MYENIWTKNSGIGLLTEDEEGATQKDNGEMWRRSNICSRSRSRWERQKSVAVGQGQM